MNDFLCVTVGMTGNVDGVMVKTASIHSLPSGSGSSMFYAAMNDLLHSYCMKEKGSSDIWV